MTLTLNWVIAHEPARNERTLSIEDGEKSIRELQDSGVTVIKLSDDEITGLKNSTSFVYDKYQSSFGAGFIDAIRQE
jgi:TRAP-type C4-dicarboxylate transport system substrate-binding protein